MGMALADGEQCPCVPKKHNDACRRSMTPRIECKPGGDPLEACKRYDPGNPP